MPESLFNKVTASDTERKKETLAQVFSCEFYEISKNTFFYRTLPVAASEYSPVKVNNLPKKFTSRMFFFKEVYFADVFSWCFTKKIKGFSDISPKSEKKQF